MHASSEFIAHHAVRGLLIDTNVLLLYAVGLCDPKSISNHKRTRQYSAEDFDILRRFVAPFHRIITTPHVLAEFSNLANIGRASLSDAHVAVLIETIRCTKELQVEKDTVLDLECFPRLGMADAGIIELARRDQLLVLTDDSRLSGYLESYDCRVVNLNHLRTPRLLGERHGQKRS